MYVTTYANSKCHSLNNQFVPDEDTMWRTSCRAVFELVKILRIVSQTSAIVCFEITR